VRSVLSEAVPAPQNAEGEAWRYFDWAGQMLAPPLEQTARARMVRAVNRIAMRYPWGKTAVEHFLDLKVAGYLANLTDPQLDDLHGRMLGYVEAAEMGCDFPTD
jgi:hypothetical protein